MCVWRRFSAERTLSFLQKCKGRPESGVTEGVGSFRGTSQCHPPSCLPWPRPPSLVTRRALPVGGDPLGQPKPGGADSSCAPALHCLFLLSRAQRTDPQAPTCTAGPPGSHSWLGVGEPHPPTRTRQEPQVSLRIKT